MVSMLPTSANPLIAAAGLGSASGYLDVDHATLQHRKYGNIFGLGDCLDLPVTKGFITNQYQVHVVRHNIIQHLAGLPLTAKYDGTSNALLYVAQKKAVWVKHNYAGPASGNLYGAENFFISSFWYYKWAKKDKSSIFPYYMKKNWGPPYFKIKQSFPK
jgi:hypothetical protein